MKWRVDFWDVVMNIVQIAGLAGTAILLKHVTPLPFWACLVVAIPSFFAFFWGTLWVISHRRK